MLEYHYTHGPSRCRAITYICDKCRESILVEECPPNPNVPEPKKWYVGDSDAEEYTQVLCPFHAKEFASYKENHTPTERQLFNGYIKRDTYWRA